VVAGAIGSGVLGGVFFAFSSFVMGALARRPDDEGLAAMQAINVVVLNPGFFAFFFGNAGVGAALVVMGIARWGSASATLGIVGGLLYVVGTFGVTAACNVPRNNAIAGLDPADPASREAWRTYLREWTLWNHVRSAAGILACGCLCVAGMV
jgi:uncharacterized membrane protein